MQGMKISTCCICQWKGMNPSYFICIDGAGNVPREINSSASDHVLNLMGQTLEQYKGYNTSQLAGIRAKPRPKPKTSSGAYVDDDEVTDSLAETMKESLQQLRDMVARVEVDQACQETIPVIKVCAACCGTIHNDEYWTQCTFRSGMIEEGGHRPRMDRVHAEP